MSRIGQREVRSPAQGTMMETSSFWSLPGPRRFVGSVAGDVSDGRSVVIVVPRAGAPAGLEQRVRDEVAERSWDTLGLGAGRDLDAARFEDAIHDLFELGTGSVGDRRTVTSLISHDDWLYRAVWVDARKASSDHLARWDGFLRQYAAASQAVPAAERSVFVSVITGKQAQVMSGSDVLLTDRWWWSVIARMDTAVHVQGFERAKAEDPVLSATVVEVAAFDLDLATELMTNWDGAIGSLPRQLEKFRSATSIGTTPEPLPSLRGHRPGRPGASARHWWDDGLVSHWDGAARWHAAGLNGELRDRRLKHLVWRAQLANLLPVIEEARLEIARWCESMRRHQRGTIFEGVDILELEYGRLLTFLRELPLQQVDQSRQELLRWMYTARNRLAHADVLTPGEVSEGRRLLEAGLAVPA